MNRRQQDVIEYLAEVRQDVLLLPIEPSGQGNHNEMPHTGRS